MRILSWIKPFGGLCLLLAASSASSLLAENPKVEEGFNALLNEETLDCYVKETLSSAVMRLKDLQRVRRPDCSAD